MQEILSEVYVQRAMLASGMVGILCGILGCFIVLRNMSLIGDALSHAVLPGVVVGFMLFGYNVMGFFAGSVVAGLFAAVLITWIQRNIKTREDAAIGIVFTSMFALGVIGISWITRKEGVHLDLKDFLFGNILGISNQDLYLTGMVLVFTLFCVIALYRFFFITTFGSVVATTLGISGSTMHYFLMLLLSFTVVASLQSVGVILVVAMLITPASAAYLLTQRLSRMIIISASIGFLSAISGLLIAIFAKTTPGPAMTLCATTIYILTFLFAPDRGLVMKARKRKQVNQRIQAEDVLKLAVRMQETGIITVADLQEKSEKISPTSLQKSLSFLQTQGWIRQEGTQIIVTHAGIQKGYDLVRAHRLWETYLADVVGMPSDQLHPDAEKHEHFMSKQLMEEVDARLGYPDLDPHGSPIPRKAPSVILSDLQIGQRAIIDLYQMSSEVVSDLWKLEMNPNHVIEVKNCLANALEVEIDGRKAQIPNLLAAKIRVVLARN